MSARVVGIGQRLAGDDAAGLAVAEKIRTFALPGVEVMALADVMGLVSILETSERVIIVDALVGGDQPGSVHVLAPEALAGGALQSLSSHGLGVAEAIAMARSLYPHKMTEEIFVVGIEIAPPTLLTEGFSPEVLLGIDGAVELVLSLARGEANGNPEEPSDA